MSAEAKKSEQANNFMIFERDYEEEKQRNNRALAEGKAKHSADGGCIDAEPFKFFGKKGEEGFVDKDAKGDHKDL